MEMQQQPMQQQQMQMQPMQQRPMMGQMQQQIYNPAGPPPSTIRVQQYSDLGETVGELFDCMADPFICAKAFCAPAIAVGEISEHVGGEDQDPCMKCVIFSVVPCNALVHLFCTTSKLREKHGMPEAEIKDMAMMFCCTGASLAQELRFVKAAKKLEFDAAVNRTVAVAPPRQMMQQPMMMQQQPMMQQQQPMMQQQMMMQQQPMMQQQQPMMQQ